MRTKEIEGSRKINRSRDDDRKAFKKKQSKR